MDRFKQAAAAVRKLKKRNIYNESQRIVSEECDDAEPGFDASKLMIALNELPIEIKKCRAFAASLQQSDSVNFAILVMLAACKVVFPSRNKDGDLIAPWFFRESRLEFMKLIVSPMGKSPLYSKGLHFEGKGEAQEQPKHI